MGVCTARLHKCGCVAIQPGERLNGIQEVSGSIPLISTKKHLKSYDFKCFFFVFPNFLQHFAIQVPFRVEYGPNRCGIGRIDEAVRKL